MQRLRDSAKGVVGSLPDGDQALAAWATALALAALQLRFEEQRSEWDMAARKGRKWLRRAIAPHDVGELLAAATAALQE